MKWNLNKGVKISIIIALLVVIAGMTLLGIFGFNSAVDFKDSYQVSVTVDQDVDNACIKAKTASEKFFIDNGLKLASYATQESDSKTNYIFKFTQKVEGIDASLKAKVEEAVDSAEREISVKTTFVKAQKVDFVLPLAISVAITMVGFFVYELLTQKAIAALTSLIISVISGILFVALCGVTRVPAMPFLPIMILVSYLAGAIFSSVMVNRFKEIAKLSGNEKMTPFELASLGAKQSIIRYCTILSAMVITSIVFAVFGGYMTFLGIQLLLVAIGSGFSAFIGTPLIYSTLKK